MNNRRPENIAVDDTNFIFKTNFSGKPDNDRFGDYRRKANLIISDPAQADYLVNAGINVRETRPRDDDDPNEFVPERFVQVLLAYRKRNGEPVKYPPRVYLVVGDSDPVLLDEESVECIDHIRVKNVNAILTIHEHDNGRNLYIRTMYVEQDLDDDPYAARYRARRGQGNGYFVKVPGM